MTLIAFSAFLLGLYIEVVTLWDQGQQLAHPLAARPKVGIIARGGGLAGLLLSGGVVAALAAAAVLLLSGAAQATTSLDDWFPLAIFSGLGLYLFFAGVVGKALLPRVNEQSILIVLLLALFNLIFGENGLSRYGWRDYFLMIYPPRYAWSAFVPPPLWLALAFLVTAAVVGLVVFLIAREKTLPPTGKAWVYLAYLGALLLIAFQDGADAYFRDADLSISEGLFFGAIFVFLILHGLFALRFVLIATSLLLPRNRPLVKPMMARLFSDEQVSRGRFGAAAAALLGIMLLNLWLGLVPADALASGLALISVQFLFRPRVNAALGAVHQTVRVQKRREEPPR